MSEAALISEAAGTEIPYFPIKDFMEAAHSFPASGFERSSMAAPNFPAERFRRSVGVSTGIINQYVNGSAFLSFCGHLDRGRLVGRE
ncbi:MAG: hypothetical protein LBP22_13255 [Deltaproteobacteria bacterium]|jgi:hypothetical protein|nr:hypothetical protein [Deltaproteobacteria bacterium]